MEMTACDCTKPTPVGLLNTFEPEYCKPGNQTVAPTPINYEINQTKEADWTLKAYVCQKWTRQKTVVGYFPYSFDTYYEQITRDPYSTRLLEHDRNTHVRKERDEERR